VLLVDYFLIAQLTGGGDETQRKQHFTFTHQQRMENGFNTSTASMKEDLRAKSSGSWPEG